MGTYRKGIFSIATLLILLSTPWVTAIPSGNAFGYRFEESLLQVDESVNGFQNFQSAIIQPSSQEWWVRGDEIVDVFVVTRNLNDLHIWQTDAGLLPHQSKLAPASTFSDEKIVLDGIQHRKITMPANLVPKLLGVNGVMTIFEDPGSPTPYSSGPISPTSVRTGELHGADDAWAMGVDGSGVKVAVVDSGIDFAHPDLNGTQARVDDPSSPYDGWPIMWDPRSVDIWMKDGEGYPDNSGSYYSDTSSLDADSNNDSVLDLTGFNIEGLPGSQSGVYHHGLHPDSALKTRAGGEVDILVVDELISGVYDTVYIDFDRDGNFSEEKPVRKGSETAGLDTNSDGLWDQSGGLLYWISDGVNGIPYGATYAVRAGYQNRVAAPGNLTLFMIDDQNDPGGNHGTLCASAISAQGEIANGKVKGMAPGAELIAVADFYAGGSFMDAWRFLAEGYDGQTDTGDEAQIGSFSFGWSNIHNDGTDQMSLYLDWLTRVHSQNTTYLVAVGNGGHGYGTTASPGGAHGVISVGAFSSQTGQSHGGTWGDAAAWSNRGPNSASRLDPDIVTVGWSATGDRGLNEVTNANSAYRTWGGTSLATPIGAGLVSLIYDSWMEEYGYWPDAMTVRDLLMSTADDRGYDPLVQGGGFANMTRAIEVIQSHNGSVWVSPASWMAGTNHGAHRDANTNILLPGQTSWANFTINGTGDVPVNVSWGGESLEPTAYHRQIWNSSTTLGWDGYQSSRPDLLIPVHIKNDGNFSLPNGTSLVRARATLPGAGFDGNNDMYEENRIYVELMRWHDDDGDGVWWTDSNNNSLVDSGEMESTSEYSMITAHTYNSGQAEVRTGWPMERDGDGLLLGVYRRNIRTSTIDPMEIEIDWTAFGHDQNSSWLSPCNGNATISPNSTYHVNCRVAVPADAVPGLRQEQVRFAFDSANGSHEWALPVIVNVASDGPVNLVPDTVDGNLSNQSLYKETWLQGAQRWGWRSESGDWKFLTFDWPYNLSGSGSIVIDVDWPDNAYTDVDVIWESESGHPYYSDDPAAYGQYNLVPEVYSSNQDIGSGKYRMETSTDSSHEVLVADATPGMKQMMLHSIRHGVNTNDNPLNISVGLVDAINGTLSKVVDDWADGQGNEIITIGSTLDLDVSSIEGFGWTMPVLLPSETATQDTPGSWSSSGYSHEIILEDSEQMTIEIDSLSPRTDLDLALYRDKNGNGVIDYGSEQIQVSGNWNSDEEITINAPTDGKWWAVVHGFDVPNGTASFWLRETILAGDSLIVNDVSTLNTSEIGTRFPNGSANLGGGIPVSAFDVNISYLLPDRPGEWQGYLVVELASGGSVKIGYDYRLDELPPILEFITPNNMTQTNQSIPISLFSADYGGGFNLSSLRIDTNPLVNWTSSMYSVEGLSDRDGLWSDYTESWGQWNSGSAVNESVGSHYQFSTQVLGIEAELPSRWSIGTTANSPEWVIQTEINASGQQFLTSDTNSGWVMATPTSSGGATYSIANLSNGTYYLWVRMSDLNGNGSGVVFELDGTPIHSTGKVLSTMNNSWEWVNSAWDGAQSTQLEFTITEPGRHNLTMRMADDGISVDELLVTYSWSFTPFGDQLNSPLISDLTLREAWVNFSLPESNVWRTFSANVTDTANRVNSTSIMVQHDNIGPSLVVNGYKFLNNISQPDLTLVTEPGVQIWLNGSELIVSENGTVDLNITLHPTWWSVRDGDPTDVTTWNWTALNEFEIVALDQAGNWNEMQFGMVYDSWGAQNINPQYPQLLVDYYRGINSDGEWILPAFTSPDALNAINGPLTFNLSVFFDTKNVCVNLLNETGIIGATGCNEFSTPPWGDEELSVEIDAPLYMGGQSEYLLDISVVLDHTNLSDGDWELQIVSEDWAGNWGTHSQMLSLDRSAPVISINTPSHNQTLDNHHLSLEWDVSEPAEQSLVFDGLLIEEFVAGPSSFSAEIILDSSGWHQICLLALDITLGPDKNLGTECIDVYLDPDAYEPSVSASWNHQIINTPKILMDLHIGDEQGWALKQWEAQGWNIQNGSELSSGNFSVWVNLNEGLNQFELEMEALDRMFVFELDVTLDTRPPLLTIDSPPDGHSTALGAIVVEGECESNLSLIVELSDIYSSTLSCAGDGTYSYKLEFPEYEGEMVLTVSSTDDAGNTATTAVELKSDKQAPRATLSWVESDCHTQPVPTISSMDPIPICDLSVRADFLDPDITFWSLSFEHERSFVTSVMGGIPEDSSILLGVGKDAAPGLWSAELIIEDAAGNRQVVNLEANLVATESTLAAKVATPLSIQNIIAIFGLLIGLGVFINRRGRRKAMNDWQEILPTPIDPELFNDADDDVLDEKWDVEDLTIPSSHGPIGSPPVSEGELAQADASLLQQVKDSKKN